MRVDAHIQPQAVGYAALGRRAAGGASFAPQVEMSSAASLPTASGVAAPAGLDALLALQAVDDLRLTRKKALRRGQQMLDTLDELKADMLAGRIGEGHLNQLLALLAQVRQQTEPGLDATLDDIELRVRVELAKFGRFATP